MRKFIFLAGTALGFVAGPAAACDLDGMFGPHRFKKDGHWYLGASPSKKSVARLKRKVHALLRPAEVGRWEEVSGRLNRVLVGWANYFS